MAEQIGFITQDVIDLLGLDLPANTPIYIGESNYLHIERQHPDEYGLYVDRIDLIIRRPDYVGISPTNGAIEYIKEFRKNNDLIKVAVRIASSGEYYVRTLYAVNERHIISAINKGLLRKMSVDI